MQPRVSIAIPCYNEAAYIERCLRSVLNQDYPSHLLEAIVADGMSTDGTREILKNMAGAHEQIHFIDNPDRHTPKALNLGIGASKGEIIIILGAHAELQADFVSENVAVLNRYPEAGCVGGVIENVNENETAAIIARAMRSPFGVGNARFRTGGKGGYVDTVAFGAYRREVFDQIGTFDEELVRNQDDEFNYRLTINGWKIRFEPSIRSKYYVRSSYSKLFRQYFQYGYWKVYVNRKHKAVTSLRQLIPFLFVCFIVMTLLGSFFSSLMLSALMAGLILWFLGALVATLWVKTPSPNVGAVISTFFLLHLGYGLGYARGVFEFLMLHRKPASTGYRTTR